MRLSSLRLMVLVALAACSDGGTGPGEETPPRVATSLAMVGGDGQSGTVGAALPQALVVLVKDQHGEPMGTVTVQWEVTAGAGSVSPASATTAANGQATTVWSLGTNAGTHAARASVSGIGTAVQFSATAAPGAPAALVRHAGEGQVGPAGEVLGVPVAVKVTDQYGNPLAGQLVTWTADAGSGSPGAPSSVSGANGVATVQWKLGEHPGSHRLRASHAQVGGEPTAFTATATPNGRIGGTISLLSSLQGVSTPGAGARTAAAMPVERRRHFEWLAAGFDDLDALVEGRAASRGDDRVPGSLIVTYHGDAVEAPSGISALASRSVADTVASRIRTRASAREGELGYATRGVSPAVLAARISVDPGQLNAVRAELLRDPAVRAVEPELLVRRAVAPPPVVTDHATATFPNDPYYATQAWHYEMIDLPEGWRFATGGSQVLVALVDDGIRYDHPDIATRLTFDGYDFVSYGIAMICGYEAAGDGNHYDPDPTLPFAFDPSCTAGAVGGHGLHVAGTIGAAGNDAAGMTGVNWNVRIRPIRVLNMAGTATNYDIAQGIVYAAGLPADNGFGGLVQAPSRAHVINLSLGGEHTLYLQSAVQAAAATGALIVAAAGNHGTSAPSYPAAYPEVLSVAAVGPDRQLASYSAYGTTVDIAAPGGDVSDGDWTFSVGSLMWDFGTGFPTYSFIDGTSMATPHVSGVAALLLSADPGLTASELRALLTGYAVDLGVPGRDDLFGHGLLNARNSLARTPAAERATYARLYDAQTGGVVQTLAAPGGTYEFKGLGDGQYLVYGGEDRGGDGRLGRAGRRWGTHTTTGTAVPLAVTISGTGLHTAQVAAGYANELEPNGSPATANFLATDGHLHARLGTNAEADYYRIMVPATGTYTFETSGWDGACGYAYEEDTILELFAADGSTILDVSDDINLATLNYCSRITRTLTPGTYYLRVTGYYGYYYRIEVRSGG